MPARNVVWVEDEVKYNCALQLRSMRILLRDRNVVAYYWELNESDEQAFRLKCSKISKIPYLYKHSKHYTAYRMQRGIVAKVGGYSSGM